MLEATILHQSNRNHPVRTHYQIAILKHIISYIENKNVEVNSEIYEEFCALLARSASEESYLHFFSDDPLSPLISLCETVSFISNGTTGLSTWPAARVLAEFCAKNRRKFENRTILELGCGTGLLGLSVIKACCPKSYNFSDCHPDVLKLVTSNIKINFSAPKQHVEENGIFETQFGGTDIRVLNLPWEEIGAKTLDKLSPDVVLAADVIYDVSAVGPLVSVFRLCASRDRSVNIFVACAVRNSETFAAFVDSVSNSGGWLSDLDVPDSDTFFPYADVPLKVFEVRFKDVS